MLQNVANVLCLGFLSTMTDEIPGNAGVLDTLEALKWVKKHISHFNGDPDQITVFGQSSGAVMVSALAISPITPKKLFNKVILQSASALSPWSFAIDPVASARDIAKRAMPSLENATIPEINAAFQTMDSYTMLRATEEYYVRFLE